MTSAPRDVRTHQTCRHAAAPGDRFRVGIRAAFSDHRVPGGVRGGPDHRHRHGGHGRRGGRRLWVAGGVAVGVFGACLVALFAGGLSQLFRGSGQELFNASISGFAVLMLGWHNVWMARHGRELAAEMRAAGQAVVEGSKSLAALAVVVGGGGAARGFGSVLFLYGVAAAQGGGSGSMLVGGIVGLVLGAQFVS